LVLGAWQAQGIDATLVSSNAVCRYIVPSSDLGTTWTAVGFNDSAWSSGKSGLGYDNETTYTTLFGSTVPNTTIVIYARYPFAVDSWSHYSGLKLRVKYDDGFIAYLNGTEVARANAPAESSASRHSRFRIRLQCSMAAR